MMAHLNLEDQISYASSLGVNQDHEPELFGLVQEMLETPLPPVLRWTWERSQSSSAAFAGKMHPLSEAHGALVVACRNVLAATNRPAAAAAELLELRRRGQEELSRWREVVPEDSKPYFSHVFTMESRSEDPRVESAVILGVQADFLRKVANRPQVRPPCSSAGSGRSSPTSRGMRLPGSTACSTPKSCLGGPGELRTAGLGHQGGGCEFCAGCSLPTSARLGGAATGIGRSIADGSSSHLLTRGESAARLPGQPEISSELVASVGSSSRLLASLVERTRPLGDAATLRQQPGLARDSSSRILPVGGALGSRQVSSATLGRRGVLGDEDWQVSSTTAEGRVRLLTSGLTTGRQLARIAEGRAGLRMPGGDRSGSGSPVVQSPTGRREWQVGLELPLHHQGGLGAAIVPSLAPATGACGSGQAGGSSSSSSRPDMAQGDAAAGSSSSHSSSRGSSSQRATDSAAGLPVVLDILEAGPARVSSSSGTRQPGCAGRHTEPELDAHYRLREEQGVTATHAGQQQADEDQSAASPAPGPANCSSAEPSRSGSGAVAAAGVRAGHRLCALQIEGPQPEDEEERLEDLPVLSSDRRESLPVSRRGSCGSASSTGLASRDGRDGRRGEAQGSAVSSGRLGAECSPDEAVAATAAVAAPGAAARIDTDTDASTGSTAISSGRLGAAVAPAAAAHTDTDTDASTGTPPAGSAAISSGRLGAAAAPAAAARTDTDTDALTGSAAISSGRLGAAAAPAAAARTDTDTDASAGAGAHSSEAGDRKYDRRAVASSSRGVGRDVIVSSGRLAYTSEGNGVVECGRLESDAVLRLEHDVITQSHRLESDAAVEAAAVASTLEQDTAHHAHSSSILVSDTAGSGSGGPARQQHDQEVVNHAEVLVDGAPQSSPREVNSRLGDVARENSARQDSSADGHGLVTSSQGGLEPSRLAGGSGAEVGAVVDTSSLEYSRLDASEVVESSLLGHGHAVELEHAPNSREGQPLPAPRPNPSSSAGMGSTVSIGSSKSMRKGHDAVEAPEEPLPGVGSRRSKGNGRSGSSSGSGSGRVSGGGHDVFSASGNVSSHARRGSRRRSKRQRAEGYSHRKSGQDGSLGEAEASRRQREPSVEILTTFDEGRLRALQERASFSESGASLRSEEDVYSDDFDAASPPASPSRKELHQAGKELEQRQGEPAEARKELGQRQGEAAEDNRQEDVVFHSIPATLNEARRLTHGSFAGTQEPDLEMAFHTLRPRNEERRLSDISTVEVEEEYADSFAHEEGRDEVSGAESPSAGVPTPSSSGRSANSREDSIHDNTFHSLPATPTEARHLTRGSLGSRGSSSGEVEEDFQSMPPTPCAPTVATGELLEEVLEALDQEGASPHSPRRSSLVDEETLEISEPGSDQSTADEVAEDSLEASEDTRHFDERRGPKRRGGSRRLSSPSQWEANGRTVTPLATWERLEREWDQSSEQEAGSPSRTAQEARALLEAEARAGNKARSASVVDRRGPGHHANAVHRLPRVTPPLSTPPPRETPQHSPPPSGEKRQRGAGKRSISLGILRHPRHEEHSLARAVLLRQPLPPNAVSAPRKPASARHQQHQLQQPPSPGQADQETSAAFLRELGRRCRQGGTSPHALVHMPALTRQVNRAEQLRLQLLEQGKRNLYDAYSEIFHDMCEEPGKEARTPRGGAGVQSTPILTRPPPVANMGRRAQVLNALSSAKPIGASPARCAGRFAGQRGLVRTGAAVVGRSMPALPAA